MREFWAGARGSAQRPYTPVSDAMATVLAKRMATEVDGAFVVFLIGMRVNAFWKIHEWRSVWIGCRIDFRLLHRRIDILPPA